jgi:hypothetical protein
MVFMKINFFIQLAGLEEGEITPEQKDNLLNLARDDDILRVLKDGLIRIRAENEPAQGG